MIIIDGSLGEGGGQIFRTSLALSMCLGKAVTIKNIRAGRNKPGLLRQHLTCLRAAKEICNAQVTGEAIGSMHVEFIPGKVQAGEYKFAIGTAGSTSLVLQTILLPLLFTGQASEVIVEGGTHNKNAPSFEFLQKSFAPVMHKMGYIFDLELLGYGFYPAGGGAIKVNVQAMKNSQVINLINRGELLRKQAVAIASKLPEHIVEREINTIAKQEGWDDIELDRQHVNSVGPGNIVSINMCFENHAEVFECIGETGLSAEKVAKRALNNAKRYFNSRVVVGEFLADQLLLPMVLAKGGVFITCEPSEHTLTNIEVIKKIYGTSIYIKQLKNNIWEIKI